MSTANAGRMSFPAAVLINLNIIVGAGIFFGPKIMATASGSVSFLGWPLVGLLLFPVIWSVAQASVMFPGAGGFYNYCKQGIGPTAGFLAQWLYLLGYLATAATLTTVLRENLVGQTGWLFPAHHPHWFNAICIVVFSALNLMKVEVISRIQSAATVLKILPLLLVIAVMAFYWNPTIEYPVAGLSSIGLTIPAAIFAYWGFEACCSIGHMLKGGPTQVGKVILTAFFISILLYMLFHLGITNIMGLAALSTDGAVAFPRFMGLSPLLANVVTTTIIGSILLSFGNSIFGIALTNITNIFVLAQQGLLPYARALQTVNRFDRPVVAACVHAVIVSALLFFVHELSILAALTNIGVSATLVMTLVAVMRSYVKHRNWVHISFTALGFVSCGVLVYFSWISISPDPWARLLYVSPLVIGAVLGLAFIKFKRQTAVAQFTDAQSLSPATR